MYEIANKNIKYILIIENDVNDLKLIIDNNKYVKECISNKSKDFNSLSSLVDMNLSQSDCIKFGNGMEKILNDVIITKNPQLKNIKPINKKGKKERDHLFKNEIVKTIYYAEIKSNLNLDTEKCKSTSDKCLQIYEELRLEYPDYIIKMYLVGTRYYDKTIIPKIIKNKYLSIEENVVGVNEYLTELGTNFIFETEILYKEFLNYLANSMFD
jgi:hypothetical protein